MCRDKKNQGDECLWNPSEAIKMVPLVQEMKKEADSFESCVVVTAQHREMLDQVLTAFEIIPDYDLDIMRPNQSLAEITSRVLLKLDEIMRQEKPIWC